MGFDFTLIVPLLPSHCGFSFVFGCGVCFLVSSSVLLSMIVQQLVVILVFLQEGVRAHPSTPPSWFLSILFLSILVESLQLTAPPEALFLKAALKLFTSCKNKCDFHLIWVITFTVN